MSVKHGVWFCLMMVLLVFSAQPAAARDVLQGDQCSVAARQTIVGDLFVLCRTLQIDGTVQGNVIGAATTAQINGRVDGSLYLLTGQLVVSAEIGRSIHFLGPALRIDRGTTFSAADADILSLSLSTQIDEGVRVPNSVVGVGYQLVLDGEIGGEVSFWGSALTLTGRIDRDVYATVGNSESAGVAELQTLLTLLPVSVALERPGLRVAEGASIEGTLYYTAPVEGSIDAELTNPPQFTQVSIQPDLAQIAAIAQTTDARRELGGFLAQVVREFLSLFLVGALVLLIFPGGFNAPLRSLASRPLPSVGLGLLTFVISFPLLAILVFFSVLVVFALGLLQLGDLTVAGAVVLSVLNLGLGTAFYFIAIFVSRALVCLGIGRIVMQIFRAGAGARGSALVQVALGALLLSVAFSLPVVGWLISAVAAFLGLGALLNYGQAQMEWRRKPASIRSTGTFALPNHSSEARQYPPPMPGGETGAPGMSNLPAGFRWWDD
jgi:cytoskeletal protein CcmA (bactofilin family)